MGSDHHYPRRSAGSRRPGECVMDGPNAGNRDIERRYFRADPASPSSRSASFRRQDLKKLVLGLYRAISERVRMIVDRPASKLHRERHKESIMIKMTKKIGLICATATMLSVMPYSIEPLRTTGITIAADQAHARIGRPLTPGSVAGVARRTTRRTVARHSYYGHHHCVWVYVNGVRVCR